MVIILVIGPAVAGFAGRQATLAFWRGYFSR